MRGQASSRQPSAAMMRMVVTQETPCVFPPRSPNTVTHPASACEAWAVSSSDDVVTARDVLSWAINQGVFTEEGTRQRELHQPVANGIDGPWIDILDALI